MPTKLRVRIHYLRACEDIFQEKVSRDTVLNDKQINTLLNLNVVDKWCIKVDSIALQPLGEIRRGCYVICLDTNEDAGPGHLAGHVFVVTRALTFLDNHVMCYGGIGGYAVSGRHLRVLTQEEIVVHLDAELPF